MKTFTYFLISTDPEGEQGGLEKIELTSEDEAFQPYVDENGETDEAWNEYINDSITDEVAEMNQHWFSAIAVTEEAMETIIKKYLDLVK